MARVRLLLAVAVAGCGSLYERLDTEPLARRRAWAAVVRRECLDLGVHLARHPNVPAGLTVVQYELGNRCDRPVRVDLPAVRVRARYADGVELDLAPRDPRRELRAATLDVRTHVFEALAYAPAAPREMKPQRVCLALDGVAPGAPAETAAPPTCLTVPPDDDLPLARGGNG